jgi:AICAR transformylase/IMP cyclohydrolase PurH
MYEKLKNSDCFIVVAGHRFDHRTMRCVSVKEGNPCGRHINDVLSDASFAKVGTQGVACYGGLTELELSTVKEAVEIRDKAFANAM